MYDLHPELQNKVRIAEVERKSPIITLPQDNILLELYRSPFERNIQQTGINRTVVKFHNAFLFKHDTGEASLFHVISNLWGDV